MRIIWRAVVGVVAFAVLFSTLPHIHAATPQRPNGLQVKPLRAYPNQAPGQTTNGSFTITNNTPSVQTVIFSAERFKTVDEDYNYAFDKDVVTEWVDFKDPQLTLQPKQSAVQNYSIAVPADATPGGRYIALLTSVEPKQTSGQNVTQINRVASLIYLEVTGAITRNSNIVSFDAPKYTRVPHIDTVFRLANTGNSHYRARIGVTMQGWPLGSRTNANPQQIETVLLPGTVRKITKQLQLPTTPGIYRITATFSPPQGGTTTKVWYTVYAPVWSILVLIISVMAIAFGLIKLIAKVRHKHRRNQHNN